MTDKLLYAVQLTALQDHYDCRVFVFLNHAMMGGIANELLAESSEKFTLIGLSLGGYVAFEVIRRAPYRLECLVLIDTTAVADHTERMKGLTNDIAKVRKGGIKALSPELPARRLPPANACKTGLMPLVDSMSHSVGAKASKRPCWRGQTRTNTCPRWACPHLSCAADKIWSHQYQTMNRPLNNRKWSTPYSKNG
jgi:pimeloyl-ACP methyl ester carboxylesterase